MKRYFRIALRSLSKNRVFSLINITGLAVGLACCLLMMAYIAWETGYDRNANQLYRVGVQLNQNGGIADYPDVDVAVGEGIKEAVPGVLASTRILQAAVPIVHYGDKRFKETNIAMCDSNFLQLFSIPLVEGDARTALVEPSSMVITRAFEKKYFGGEPGLGKTLLLAGGAPFKVTGVVDKIPDQTHFHFDAFLSITSSQGIMHNHTWSNIGFYTYLLLQKGVDPKTVERQLPPLVEKYVVPEVVHDMGVSLAEARKSIDAWHFYLMPVRDIHLQSHTKYELEPGGDSQYVYIFAALAVFILLLACVNFTNLSTASSAGRSREIGIRKVLGSIRSQLVTQFLTESLLLTLAAMLLALGLVWLLLPWFNQVSGKSLPFGYFLSPGALATDLGLVVLAGFLAGVYPAFFLSSFKILQVLRGKAASGRRSTLRSTLVVFQFIISTSLIIATLIVYRQLYYMQHKKLGYDKDQVVFLKDAYGLQANQYAFKQHLLADPRVTSVSLSRDVPVELPGMGSDGTEVFAKENKDNETASEIHTNIFHVDYDYIKTLGMTIVTGRNLSADFPGDSSAVVINESAVRDLGYKNNQVALDKIIVGSGQKEWHVVGIVEDFHYTSVKQKIAPLMMMLGHNFGGVLIKIHTGDVEGVLDHIRTEWTTLNNQLPFDYYFLDDRFAALYSQEQKTGQIFTLFAAVAIVIASLGLFGLVAFTVEKRTKEIGIRKVLGANATQLVFLLAGDFLRLVSIALVIAIPLTWMAMHRWLENFAYQTGIAWWIFALAGISALGLALVTISFRAIRAALANPVKSLRSE
ncbi:ABC transporter permease [Dinghuibacter silviterrae]|uniref:Putative ABC transport system permease protein n=1 Tax=Dinghuibacter silviterrae TaxID=1539049 RepID=A0A4R8DUI1_9BACT|nr:ABC transporter permease [Dinghuibacter silviterrae]TDX01578.1 putative ABC transport system permease protein [Dinghuibacter silviterrae]